MADRQPLNATFFAFRKRDRAVLLPASLLYALIVALLVAAFLALNWSTLNQFFALIRERPETLSDAEGFRMFSGMMGMFGWLFLLLFPFYIATAAYEAACLRWMIRGEAPGLFGLTLNNDTWRVWGLYWIWLIVSWVVSFAASIVMLPLMFMMIGDIAVTGGAEPNSAEMVALQLKLQAISLIQYIPLAFIGIRLGPAAATSIARKRFSFFEAWSVTSDRFFALLGSYALLWLIFGVAYIVLFGAQFGILLGQFAMDVAASWPDVPADLGQRYLDIIFAPSSWLLIGAGYAIGLALTLTYTVLSYGINARAALAALEEGKIKEEPPES